MNRPLVLFVRHIPGGINLNPWLEDLELQVKNHSMYLVLLGGGKRWMGRGWDSLNCLDEQVKTNRDRPGTNLIGTSQSRYLFQ